MKAFFSSILNIVIIILGIIGILAILYAWGLPPFTSEVKTTDNAYVKGFVTNLAPQISGDVVNVTVQDYQKVKKGELLVKIDDSTYRQELNQASASLDMKKAILDSSYQQEASAKAQIESAEATLTKAKADWTRVQSLTGQGYQSQSQYDSIHANYEKAKADLDVAQQSLKTIITNRQGQIADIEGAKAAVSLAQINLERTNIYAPVSGRVGAVGVRLGQYVSPGTQLMAVVPDEIWVTANFKETQINNMKIGQPAHFTVDALRHKKMTGRVERFSPAAGIEFAVLKPDNATGNFTKVVQRIPVRIHIDPNQEDLDRLVPGMSVVVSVDTGAPGIIQETDNQPEK